MSSVQLKTLPPPRQVVAALCGVFAELGAGTCHIGGRILFDISGDTGGRWLLDLDVPGGQWVADGADELATRVRATPDGFACLLLAPDRLGELYRAGELDVRGDGEQLQRLAAAFDESQILAAFRLATSPPRPEGDL